MSTAPNNEEYVLDIESCLQSQAWSTARAYRGFVDQEDMASEGQIWLLENPAQVQKYIDHDQPKLAYHWLSRDLWKAMDQAARRERAQRLGFEPDDEALYGKAVLEALLPAVLNEDPVQPQGEHHEIRASKDPAEGGTFLAMYIDACQAWENAVLTDQQRLILTRIYGEGYTQQEVADQLGVGRTAVTNSVKRALKKLADYLNGGYSPDTSPE